MSSVIRKARWSHFVESQCGRGIIVPMDHGLTMGPVEGLNTLEQVSRWIGHPAITGIIAHKGLVERLGGHGLLQGFGVMVHLNGMTSLASHPDDKARLTSVESAMRLGADAVSLQLNFTGTNDTANLSMLGAVVDEAQRYGLPVLTMLYDKVREEDAGRWLQRQRHLMRACVELGTDALKLAVPRELEWIEPLVKGVREHTAVFFAGGSVREEEDILQLAHEVVRSGATGLCVGRNIFQRPTTLALLSRLQRVLLGGPRPAARPVREPAPARRPLLVQKFGGTSVADTACIRRAARRALASQRAGHDVVVVVSAMSGETDRLLRLAHEVLPQPDRRELDVVAATGEQVSAALTALAIQAEGGKATSFLGHQLPLLTDSAFCRARIEHVDTGTLRQALDAGHIAVVAGFQGVDEQANITTLGRGGSDLSAVALAAALQAEVCEIYTDVEGVFTADPRVCPSSRKLSELSYEEMLEFARQGAKVLQASSVEFALRHGVPLHVRSSFSAGEGTWIQHRRDPREDRALGLACVRGQVRVELVEGEERPELAAELAAILASQDVNLEFISRVTPEEGGPSLVLALPEAELERAAPVLRRLLELSGARELLRSGPMDKVSLVGAPLTGEDCPRILDCLAGQGIPVSELWQRGCRVSFLVEAAQADAALRCLHEALLSASPLGWNPMAAGPETALH